MRCNMDEKVELPLLQEEQKVQGVRFNGVYPAGFPSCSLKFLMHNDCIFCGMVCC